MSVFDAVVKTPLATGDPLTDYMLPVAGELAYAAITTVGALSSTTGHDTLLLKGDRDRQMHGNENTRIDQNRTHDVGGNQKKTISGNKNENVSGNFDHQTNGNMSRSIVGSTNDLHTGKHTIAHKSDQNVQEPVNFLHFIQNLQNKGLHYEQLYGFYTSVIGLYTNVVTSNLDFKGLQFGLTGAEANFTGPSVAKHDAKIKAAELESRFQLIESQIGAIEPAVYVTNVHAVAITLIAGVALGENQAI